MDSELVLFVAVLIAVGSVGGFLARWIVPGPDPIGVGRTVLIGMVGSLVGGFLAFWLFGADTGETVDWAAGVLGAVTGSTVALMVDNFVTGRKDQITMGPP